MGEFICYSKKDVLVMKAPKKSPCFLRMILLVLALVCGVCVCAICLMQSSPVMQTEPRTAPLVPDLPHGTGNRHLGTLDSRYVHYPRPKTFSRQVLVVTGFDVGVHPKQSVFEVWSKSYLMVTRAECEHNPVRLFAILSMQRSGSGWFETLLNSHINVTSNGEIFSVAERRKKASTILATLDKVYNMDWFSSASKNECSAAVGFKWMLNQGLMQYRKEIVKYFNLKGVSAIFLIRRNLLRRMISISANSYDRRAKLLNGAHKSHVHTEKEAEKLSSYKPEIECETLLSDLKQDEAMVTEALESFNTTRHLDLYYEDLVRNSTKLKDVLEFLNLPQTELTSQQVKIHKGELSDLIKNWAGVAETLKGTAYESFLADDIGEGCGL